MAIEQLIILLGTGIGVGFLSGLLGIGGGLIMTPVQLWLYTSSGMDLDLAVKIAFATSLAVILPTAASGTWRHQKQGNIVWKPAIFMGTCAAVGGFVGATIATHISGSTLKNIFGVVILLMAIRMLTLKVSDTDKPLQQNLWLWFAMAFPIGVLTGILGIGGGIFVVPMLVIILGFCIRNAAATSLAMMLFTTVGGIIGYIVNGLNIPELPAYTIGYVNWPGFIALAIGSITMAQVGAMVAHRVPSKLLNYIMVAIQLYVGLDMLGVWRWIATNL